jgi:tetratricopeptide (TPR) repeat protein
MDIGTAGMDRTPTAFLHRELLILVGLIAIGIASFVATRAFAAANARARAADAATWLERGRAALSHGDLDSAVSMLRRATRMNRDNRTAATLLAASLDRSGNSGEAVEILEQLRESRPDDPDVATELARLEHRRGDVRLAIRYYQDALDALWAPGQREDARAVRSEFVELLLAANERARALSETLVLASDLPPDPYWQIRAGQFFLAGGDPNRALERFTAALAYNPRDAEALAGAGEAAFDFGNYAEARRYLAAVPNPPARVSELKAVSEMVIADDPLAVRLTRGERQRRIAALLDGARARLDACPPAGDDGSARQAVADALEQAIAPARGTAERQVDQERAEQVVELAAGARSVTAGCTQPDVQGRAVLLIAQMHGLGGDTR